MVSLPIISDSLELYIAQINKFPLLDSQQEFELAVRFREKNDIEAAHRLVTSNLRFVLRVALEYRSYGVSLVDLVQEGNLGLMMAVRKFDPHRGYRLISYAVWWIRAYIQNFIIRTWSLVKLGTTQKQKRLFYSLKKTRRTLRFGESVEDDVRTLAERLGVLDRDIIEMDQRMSHRDFSLDSSVGEDRKATHLNMLANDGPNQEELVGDTEERRGIKEAVDHALGCLNTKERCVIENRTLSQEPATLRKIGDALGVSRERVRQIEGDALRKLRGALSEQGPTWTDARV